MSNRSWQIFLNHLQRQELSAAEDTLESCLASFGGSAADRTLCLHLGALVRFAVGRRVVCSQLLAEASEVERRMGWNLGAQHTSHQWALLAPTESSLNGSKRYYRQTVDQLRRLKHWAGAGLCLRSLGELAVVGGRADQGLLAWQSAERLLRHSGEAEADQVQTWMSWLQQGPDVRPALE